MLFGSQFLREVYEGDSLSTVVDKQGQRMQTAPDEDKEKLTSLIMNRPAVRHTDGEEIQSVKYSTVLTHAQQSAGVKRSKIDLT